MLLPVLRIVFIILYITAFAKAQAPKVKHIEDAAKTYQLYYTAPAPDLPIVPYLWTPPEGKNLTPTPYDEAWESWSLPIGNGYMGANIFGRTKTERVQLTENSLAAKSQFGAVGLTNFAELYIDFNHSKPVNYQRGLSLNKATSWVKYEQDGVRYEREYFASYPDKVLVIKLTASKKGKLSFTVRPEIPYLKEFGAASDYNGRSGTVVAKGNLLTLSGQMEHLNILYEGQIKVMAMGGQTVAHNDAATKKGSIEIKNANSAIIIVAIGTNYKLDSTVFTEGDFSKKLQGNPPPHEKVSAVMQDASQKKYQQLLANHLKDYQNLFSRVAVDWGGKKTEATTDQLLKDYKAGVVNHYLEELYFQFGRYLLICSSRPGTLPPNLQGIWSQYDVSPWTGGYWHNINVQMNYWPVFNTNLTELFKSYSDYNIAFRNEASRIATDYIRTNNSKSISTQEGENGWTIGTGANAYAISAPGGHSGPGTGALTSKLFTDYFEFTGDTTILKKVTYPAILGMSKFLARTVIDTLGLQLASPSASPEQIITTMDNSKEYHYYITTGCAFDQQMIYENHQDVIRAAKLVNDNSPLIQQFQNQLPKLDPVQIGLSGQVKEFREENYYGDTVYYVG